MPEIKHQFTGGRMNKDLDERLIKNGEYRDAMNIQVSTSEDSDVGTVQNILGNSLVLGQDIVGDNSHCVGSIADEKNDKLYYFICSQENVLPDMELWTNTAAIIVDHSGEGVFLSTTGNSGSNNIYPSFRSPNIDLVDGQNYRLEIDVSDIYQKDSSVATKIFMVGNTDNGGNTSYRPFNEDNAYNYHITKSGIHSFGLLLMHHLTTVLIP